jgi:hypothetical protein
MSEREGSGGPGKFSATTTTTGGALGLGLMALGTVLGLLILAWLAVNLAGGVLRGGGFVIGLMLLAVLALPLLGAGWYLRRQARAESREAAILSRRRAALDADRVVRRELARELEQRAAGLLSTAAGLPGDQVPTLRATSRRLQELAEDVSRPGYDATTWLDRSAAGAELDQQLETVRRYDDLVIQQARRLEAVQREVGRAPDALDRLTQEVDALEARVAEREALFGRGRRAASLTPQELLAAGARPRQRVETPLELNLEDAVTYELDDYLVRAVLTYFAGGRSWRAYQLHDGKQERWLEVRAAGHELSWYRSPPATGTLSDDAVEVDGTTFTAAERGSATVDIESTAGRQTGALVDFRRYTGPDSERLVLEQWHDGVRALVGRPIAVEDLQLWKKSPAELPADL